MGVEVLPRQGTKAVTPVGILTAERVLPGLARSIVELHPQRLGANDLDGFNSVDMMLCGHTISKARWAAVSRRPAACSNLTMGQARSILVLLPCVVASP